MSLASETSPSPATRRFVDRPAHRWRVLGLGVAANACFSAILAGIPSTGVLMRSDYRLSTGELGLALSMLGLGVATSELPWGFLTDRWGDRRVLLTGLALIAGAFLLMAVFIAPAATIPSLSLLAASLLIAGLLGGSVNGSSGRAVMAWFAEGERGLAMSIRQSAVPLGGGLGAVILPPLAAHIGFIGVYAALAAASAVTAAFTWAWLHEPPHPAATTKSTASRAAATTSPLRDNTIWRIALGIGLLCLPQIAVLSFTTIFLHDTAGAGIALTSGTLIAVQGGAAVIRIWSGRYTDRHRNRRAYLRVCALITAVLFLALGLASGLLPTGDSAIRLPVLVTLLIAGGIAASAWHGVAFTELASIAGVARVGTALGLGNTCAFAAFFLAPIGIPLLLSLISWPGAWLAAVLAALIAWRFFPPAPQAFESK